MHPPDPLPKPDPQSLQKPSAGGLSIMVWSCDRSRAELAATPFMVAQAAAALDLQVEMLFTAHAIDWLRIDAGDDWIGFGPERLRVRDYLDTCAQLGIVVRACGQAMRATGTSSADLVPQCSGASGMVSFVERCQDAHWRTLVF